MKKFIAIIVCVILQQFAMAQSDTVYHYYSKSFIEVGKDSAYTTLKLIKKQNLWYGIEYYNNGKIRSEGNFTESDAKEPIGTFKNYKEDGVLDNTREWENGKTKEINYLYKNGSKRSWIRYAEKGANEQKGWDESGKEIKNFVVEREARFKGGLNGWVKFLEKNLNANVAVDAGAPPGDYEVKIQFIVSKEGYVSNVKAVSIPAACKPCAREAVSVISTGPNWEPAIQNNEPVNYNALQYITFQVDEGKKGKKQ